MHLSFFPHYRHTGNVTFRPSKAAEISLAQSCHIKTCAVRCVDRAYAVLFILHNTVLNDCEIKAAIRAMQAYELYGPLWDSCFEENTGGFILVSSLPTNGSHDITYHFPKHTISF